VRTPRCSSRSISCAPVSDGITRGRNAIFGHVARLPDNIPAHQAKSSYRSVDPQTLHGNVHQVDHVPNGPTNSAAMTTMFPLRLCGGKLLAAVTRQRRYGPSRLRVNDDDDDEWGVGVKSAVHDCAGCCLCAQPSTTGPDGVLHDWHIAITAHVVISLSQATRLTGVRTVGLRFTRQTALDRGSRSDRPHCHPC